MLKYFIWGVRQSVLKNQDGYLFERVRLGRLDGL
jgi:hypothetical protein